MVLKKGMKGTQVKELQEKLSLLGYSAYLEPWGCDGDFGNATFNAVRSFQKDNNLMVDGIVDKLTWNKIIEILDLDTDDGSIKPNYKYYKIASTHIVEVDPLDLGYRYKINLLMELN